MERILLFGLVALAGRAMASPTTRSPAEFNHNDAVAYLSNYGQLPPVGDPETASFTSIELYRMAMMEFQQMAGIPVTGELDAATIEMMSTPRCGVKDSGAGISGDRNGKRKKRFALAGSIWQKKDLTYKFVNINEDLGSQTQGEFRRAFDLWEQNSGLTFREVGRNQRADIDISFARGEHGDGYAFDGQGNVLAHAFFPEFGGDAHFDEDEYYTKDSSRGTNLLQVAAHEIGHSLGLLHSENSNALMAPFYRGYVPNYRLHSDDIQGIQRLYGAPSTGGGSGGGGNPPTTTTTTTTRAPSTDRPTDSFCQDAQFDCLVVTDDGSTYGFRGENYFKIGRYGALDGYPRRIRDDWPGLPNNLDAGVTWESPYYEQYRCQESSSGWCYRRQPAKTHFFKGSYVYTFINQRYQEDKRISQFMSGLPSNLDAAMVWRNGKTYFFKGTQYYRANNALSTRVDYGYPRSIDVWFSNADDTIRNKLNQGIDTALKYTNGRTYFFKGEEYYRFNDVAFNVDAGYPRPVDYWWYGCRDGGSLVNEGGTMDNDDNDFEPRPDEAGGEVGDNGAVTMTTAMSLLTSCLCFVLVCLF